VTYEFSKPRITVKIGAIRLREDWNGRVDVDYQAYTNPANMTIPIEALANLNSAILEFARETTLRDAAFDEYKNFIGTPEDGA
jgi:hypothetical protein